MNPLSSQSSDFYSLPDNIHHIGNTPVYQRLYWQFLLRCWSSSLVGSSDGWHKHAILNIPTIWNMLHNSKRILPIVHGHVAWCFTTASALKSRVYINRLKSLLDLKANIREEIANIPAYTLVSVMANTRNRYHTNICVRMLATCD